MAHDLYEDGDKDIPPVICDSNGQVVLGLCKKCGKGESELFNDDGSASDCVSPFPDPNPWHPMTNAVDLKCMGKFGEEVNELGAAISRCIIQGVDEKEPTTGKVNRRWLEEEIADVIANLDIVTERWELDIKFIYERAERKRDMLKKWHAQA